MESIFTKNIKNSSGQKPATCPSVDSACRPLTREDIKTALKNVYAAETKPVKVGSVKARTSTALILIIIGTAIVSIMLLMKYLALNAVQIIPGIVILIISFLVGFTISTSNIRTIYRSMSRFKDLNVPAYRKIFPSSKWQSQALVYATLICLVFLGAQSLSLFVVQDRGATLDDNTDFDSITLSEGSIWIEDDTTFQPTFVSGQYFMKIHVKINNTMDYYSDNLILDVKSHFAGQVYDNLNLTLSEPGMDELDVSIKIHEPEDTSIMLLILHQDKTTTRKLYTWYVPNQKDIYITDATSKISTKFPFSKSLEIKVSVYNDGLPRFPETLSLVVTSQALSRPYYREFKNNETIGQDEFWVYTFKIDNVIDEEWIFDVELKVDDETEDTIQVFSG